MARTHLSRPLEEAATASGRVCALSRLEVLLSLGWGLRDWGPEPHAVADWQPTAPPPGAEKQGENRLLTGPARPGPTGQHGLGRPRAARLLFLCVVTGVSLVLLRERLSDD